jgi:hypothetical protein
MRFSHVEASIAGCDERRSTALRVSPHGEIGDGVGASPRGCNEFARAVIRAVSDVA